MRQIIFLSMLLLLSTPGYSEDEIPQLPQPPQDKLMNCDLIDKKLTVLRSELAVVIEQYKMFFKEQIMPKLREASGQNQRISIDGKNKYAAAIAKLSLAAATYEALGDSCREIKAEKDKTN